MGTGSNRGETGLTSERWNMFVMLFYDRTRIDYQEENEENLGGEKIRPSVTSWRVKRWPWQTKTV